MREMIELEALGYAFSINGAAIKYSCKLEHPDPAVVYPLLEALRMKRDEALTFLHQRESGKQILPVMVPIKDAHSFLQHHNLHSVGFNWPAGGDATLFVEPNYKKSGCGQDELSGGTPKE